MNSFFYHIPGMGIDYMAKLLSFSTITSDSDNMKPSHSISFF